MPELDDHDLLAEFAGTNSEPAFAALVARHLNLIYSTALRFTGNSHHAEEITQAVFIILAQKAGKLSARVVLSGWLYQVARFTTANFLKGEIRRQHREQEAYMQTILNEPDALTWQQIAPLLDEAMGGLGETDRNAIVLRFFENKTAAEAASQLNLTEAATHKRVNRALEKLRKFFTKRGVSSTTAIIAGAISAHSVHAAPVALAKSVTAVAIVKGAIAMASTLTLVKGTMKIMTWLKIKAAMVIGVASLIVGGTAVIAFSRTNENPIVQPKAVSKTRHETTVIGLVNVQDYKVALLEFRDWFPNGNGSMTSRAIVSAGQSFEDKMIKDTHVKIEITGINYTNGVIEAREDGRNVVYRFKAKENPNDLIVSSLRLNDLGFGAIFDLYAAISGRTLLVHPAANNKNPVMVTTNPHNQAELIQALENELGKEGFAVLPDGNKFEQIVPNELAKNVRPHSPVPIAPNGQNEMMAGGVNFENVPFEQIRAIYAQLSGREILQEPGLPAISISLKAKGSLTKPELLHAMDILLGWQGVKITILDEKTSKAIRIQPDN